MYGQVGHLRLAADGACYTECGRVAHARLVEAVGAGARDDNRLFGGSSLQRQDAEVAVAHARVVGPVVVGQYQSVQRVLPYGEGLVVGERTTLGAEVAFNNQPWKQDIKLVSVMPEFRFWFNGRPFTRQYVGLVGNFSIYDVAFEHVYNGDALGLGLSFGHAWTLTKRISIDFSGSVGVIGYKQMYHKKDELLEGNGIVANSRGHMLMPIKLGVSLVYVIK